MRALGYLTIAEAAQVAAVHVNTIRLWVRSDRVVHRRAGTNVYVKYASLREYGCAELCDARLGSELRLVWVDGQLQESPEE